MVHELPNCQCLPLPRSTSSSRTLVKRRAIYFEVNNSGHPISHGFIFTGLLFIKLCARFSSVYV